MKLCEVNPMPRIYSWLYLACISFYSDISTWGKYPQKHLQKKGRKKWRTSEHWSPHLQTPILTAASAMKSLKCHRILYWCAHPSSGSAKPSKIYFLCWPRVWLAALEKLCGRPDIHQLAWTILGGRQETGSSDHLSLWLMLQRVFWIWHVVAWLMPACLVLTYWAGRQTCIDIKRGTLKRNQLLSPSRAEINNKLCYLSWPHTLSPL